MYRYTEWQLVKMLKHHDTGHLATFSPTVTGLEHLNEQMQLLEVGSAVFICPLN